MISINRSLIYDRIKSGIPNIENTCYLNSFLQILASNNEFCEKIQHTENRLLSTLSSLLSSIRNPGSGNIKQLVRLFINQVNAEFPMFSIPNFNDPKEVMAVIMGKLSDLCNDTSFSITFENHFICHACSSITKCNEISESIVVPRNNCNSIQDTLENLREPKIFYGDNKLYCERCDQPRDITIETEGIDWPSTISFYFPSHNNRRIEINEELNIEGIIAILFNKITFIWLYVFSSTTFSLSNSPSATFG